MKINVNQRYADWIAFLDGDKTRLERGNTPAEAIGNLVISHHEALGIDLEMPAGLWEDIISAKS